MIKKPIMLGALVIVILGAAFLYLNMNQSTTPAAQAKGRVVVGVSDASASITGVTSIMMTVDKVEVENAAQGWVAVSSGAKQYDLLVLKKSGAVALLADINISAGTYDQIRLTISKVTVTVAGKTQDAKLPSGTLKMVGRVVVEEGKTASVVLDFKADKSLHVTGNGKFILAPVVNLQTKSDASVTKESDDTLKIDGGKIEEDKNEGMDEHGDTKDNFELDTKAKFEIDSEDIIHVTSQKGMDEHGDTKDNLELDANAKIEIDSKDIIHATSQNGGETQNQGETRNIIIQNFTFNQKSITVKKGDTVVWTNKDSTEHTVTGNNGSPSSPTISANGTYSYTFNNTGIFDYHCAIHPSMTGTVVVTE